MSPPSEAKVPSVQHEVVAEPQSAVDGRRNRSSQTRTDCLSFLKGGRGLRQRIIRYFFFKHSLDRGPSGNAGAKCVPPLPRLSLQINYSQFGAVSSSGN